MLSEKRTPWSRRPGRTLGDQGVRSSYAPRRPGRTLGEQGVRSVCECEHLMKKKENKELVLCSDLIYDKKSSAMLGFDIRQEF